MKIEEVARLVAERPGLSCIAQGGYLEWRRRGRLVARQMEHDQLLIRCDFDDRDLLLRAFPGTFSVPQRYRRHMMVVANLAAGDPEAIEDAIDSAWLLQGSY